MVYIILSYLTKLNFTQSLSLVHYFNLNHIQQYKTVPSLNCFPILDGFPQKFKHLVYLIMYTLYHTLYLPWFLMGVLDIFFAFV